MVKLEYSVEEPLNQEPPIEELVDSFITTNGYDRNHGPIPHLSASTHTISITGLVRTPLTLSISALQTLPQHTVICALQCAGNRRHTMRTKLKEVNGIDWFDGAVMNCKWKGPLLKDVLEMAMVDVKKGEEGKAHVQFACRQTECQDDGWYGASVPMERCLRADAEIILALERNGEPLPPNHGAPVRVITPGIAGARSVKWLDSISIELSESPNYYQQHDYKILPPCADSAEEAEKWWPKVPAIQDMPVNSVIAVPKSNSKVERDEDGCIEVRGYALPSGADGPVIRVEVSTDDGKTWVDAELDQGQHLKNEEKEGVSLKWAWCLWNAKVQMEKGRERRILSRATDMAGNVQEACAQWNWRGVAYNGFGEVEGLEVA
ncbi:putative sulfite oxidase [Delitschia confertaspora ATCC 74209]|uniref:Sulfite oxidase n=1 Tax=Delitschia confertaspora ATCC 74209 TaxID=1513339 RepID=A0A9P4JPS7_9PLEO|nr:putative sulfite oxidase [Delitschia confertaspora ATCC 74209]